MTWRAWLLLFLVILAVGGGGSGPVSKLTLRSFRAHRPGFASGVARRAGRRGGGPLPHTTRSSPPRPFRAPG